MSSTRWPLPARRRTEAGDALIAAAALSRGLAVHACDPDDFRGIERLEVVEVPRPDR